MSAFDSDEEQPIPHLRPQDSEGTRAITEYMRRSRVSTDKKVESFERTLRRERREKTKGKPRRAHKKKKELAFDFTALELKEWNETYLPTLDSKDWDECYVCKEISEGYAEVARDRKTGLVVSVMQWDAATFEEDSDEEYTAAWIDAIGTRNDHRGRGIAMHMINRLRGDYDVVIVPLSAHDKFWSDAGFTNLNDVKDKDLGNWIWELVESGPFEYVQVWNVFFVQKTRR